MTEQRTESWKFPGPFNEAARVAAIIADDNEVPFLHHVIGIDPEHGLQVQPVDTERHQPFPRRPAGNRTVSELDSFLAELDRRPLGDAGTLWGKATEGKLVAVYNDHDPVPNVGGWRDDTLTLQLKQDPDWAEWHTMSGQYYPQQAFGDRVEELLHTVIDPDQADLLEIIDTVRASSKGEFESSINRGNGAQRLTFHTEISASAGKSTNHLEVPQMVKLSLRPWEGHANTYEVQAYFRLKIEGNRLTLAVKLKPTRQIVRAAWSEVTEAVTAAISKPVYAQ